MMRQRAVHSLLLPCFLLVAGCGSQMPSRPSPDDAASPPPGAPALVFVAYRSELAAYHQNPQTGALTFAARTPWSTDQVPGADPRGRFLFASEGGQVTAWRVRADGSATRVASSAQGPGVLHPSGRFAYTLRRVVGPSCDIQGRGATFAVSAGDGGILEQPDGGFATGFAPWSLAFGAAGRFAYVTNFGDSSELYTHCRPGSISAYAVQQDTGRLSQLGTFAVGPAHTLVRADDEGRLLFVAHRQAWGDPLESRSAEGLSVYAIDPVGGGLSPAPQGVFELPHPGVDVPWGLVVEPHGRLAFLTTHAEDDDGQMLLHTLGVGAQGQLTPLGEPRLWGISTGFGPRPRTLRLSPDGRFAYVHVPGSSQLLVARVDTALGLMESTAPPVTVGGDALGIVVLAPAVD